MCKYFNSQAFSKLFCEKHATLFSGRYIKMDQVKIGKLSRPSTRMLTAESAALDDGSECGAFIGGNQGGNAPVYFKHGGNLSRAAQKPLYSTWSSPPYPGTISGKANILHADFHVEGYTAAKYNAAIRKLVDYYND